MSDMLALAESNLLSPMVLFFALGFIAAAVRSDLHFPEAVAKALSLYLLAAIGFKGGVIVAESGIDAKMMATIGAGIFVLTGKVAGEADGNHRRRYFPQRADPVYRFPVIASPVELTPDRCRRRRRALRLDFYRHIRCRHVSTHHLGHLV